MDAATERKMAALIMAQAARLKRQADEEGILACLNPKVRARPNSQFLRATVRSVEQVNRITDVNEMWRKRQTEIQREKRHTAGSDEPAGEGRAEEEEGGGLSDEAMKLFLRSRAKRGRGAVGSRMDHTGPFPAVLKLAPGMTASAAGAAPGQSPAAFPEMRTNEDWEERVLGAQAHPSLGRSDARKRARLADPAAGVWEWERGERAGGAAGAGFVEETASDQSEDEENAAHAASGGGKRRGKSMRESKKRKNRKERTKKKRKRGRREDRCDSSGRGSGSGSSSSGSDSEDVRRREKRHRLRKKRREKPEESYPRGSSSSSSSGGSEGSRRKKKRQKPMKKRREKSEEKDEVKKKKRTRSSSKG
eukprot:jgi/Mesen1/6530/ME000333S05835